MPDNRQRLESGRDPCIGGGELLGTLLLTLYGPNL